jgi:hypothetical protein
MHSLYRQLEGLEATLKDAGESEEKRWFAAYNSQESFNSILEKIRAQCAAAPEYLQTLDHIQPASIPKGGNKSVYPRFLNQVVMLRQAVRAFLELALSQEQKQKIGFI